MCGVRLKKTTKCDAACLRVCIRKEGMREKRYLPDPSVTATLEVGHVSFSFSFFLHFLFASCAFDGLLLFVTHGREPGLETPEIF